jgi:cystathionine beta-lyase
MTTTQTFELTLDELRARQGSKWNYYAADVLPAWVADMDFRIAEPIQAALRQLVEQTDFGYGFRMGERSLEEAFVQRMQERYGWAIEKERVRVTTEVVQCLHAAIMVFSEPGDGVLTQTPIYPPFLMTIDAAKRRRVENLMIDDGSRFVIDIEGMRKAADSGTKVILLCSPHNPTGRVFTREELRAIGDLAVERDMVIVCDEIHADLAYPDQSHIPIATLSPEIAARTITVTSATKAFNLAGLPCATMHFGSAALQARFEELFPPRITGTPSVPAVDATVAAWRQSQGWLDAVMAHLQANRDHVAQFVTEHLPGIVHHKPEATYLYWLDCRNLNLPGESPFDFFLNEAKVGLNQGSMFGSAGDTFVRLNFATSREVLDQVLARMADAVERAPAR